MFLQSVTAHTITSLKNAVQALDTGLFYKPDAIELEPEERAMFTNLTALYKQCQMALSQTVQPWLNGLEPNVRKAKEQAIFGDSIFYLDTTEDELSAGEYLNSARLLHRAMLNAQREMGDAVPANDHGFEHALDKTSAFLRTYGLVQLHTSLSELHDVRCHIEDSLEEGALARGVSKLLLRKGNPEFNFYSEFHSLLTQTEDYFNERVTTAFVNTPEACVETEQTLIGTQLPSPPNHTIISTSPYAHKATCVNVIEALSEAVEIAESELGETANGKELVTQLQAFCEQQKHQRGAG